MSNQPACLPVPSLPPSPFSTSLSLLYLLLPSLTPSIFSASLSFLCESLPSLPPSPYPAYFSSFSHRFFGFTSVVASFLDLFLDWIYFQVVLIRVNSLRTSINSLYSLFFSFSISPLFLPLLFISPFCWFSNSIFFKLLSSFHTLTSLIVIIFSLPFYSVSYLSRIFIYPFLCCIYLSSSVFVQQRISFPFPVFSIYLRFYPCLTFSVLTDPLFYCSLSFSSSSSIVSLTSTTGIEVT